MEEMAKANFELDGADFIYPNIIQDKKRHHAEPP